MLWKGGAGTAHPSGAPGFITGLWCGWCCSIFCFVCNVIVCALVLYFAILLSILLRPIQMLCYFISQRKSRSYSKISHIWKAYLTLEIEKTFVQNTVCSANDCFQHITIPNIIVSSNLLSQAKYYVRTSF